MDKLRIEVTSDRVPSPGRATAGSAGIDLALAEDAVVRGGYITTVNLPYKVAIPDGHVGILALRSSIGARGITIPNGVGIIDSDYRGPLRLPLTALPGTGPFIVRPGERVAQLVTLPALLAAPTADDVDSAETARGDGGFGSTGTAALTAGGDAVNHPSHYAGYDPEVIVVTERLGFREGNVVKYLARAGRKPGAPEQLDLDKAHWYMCRTAYDKDGTFNRGALVAATGVILGTIAALTPATSGPWQDVFDAVTALSEEIEDNA